MIKQRKSCKQNWLLSKVTADFNKDVYRNRGIIEGVFGGTETKYSNRTRCRLDHTREVSVLLIFLAQNLKTYNKASYAKNHGLI